MKIKIILIVIALVGSAVLAQYLSSTIVRHDLTIYHNMK